MPELNCMKCSIELSPTNKALDEYNISYSNQQVDCFVRVPEQDSHFSIKFTTTGFVGPGIAVFVFIDGIYQANRNRTGLVELVEKAGDIAPQVEFVFRQKEETEMNGRLIIGRDWRFSTLAYARPEDIPTTDETFLANLGTIEVVVLRCTASTRKLSGPATDFGSPIHTTIAKRKGKQATCETASGTSSEHRPPRGQLDGATDGGWGTTNDNANGDWATSNNQQAKGWDGSQKADPNQPKPDVPPPGWGGTEPAKVKAAVEAGEVQYTDWAEQAKRGYGGFSSRRFRESTDVILNSGIAPDKSYWAKWHAGSRGYSADDRSHNKSAYALRDPFVSPAYEVPKVCKDFATSRGVQHQTITGKGARYSYPSARPTYFDCMERPFAVFSFHYRGGASSRHIKPENSDSKPGHPESSGTSPKRPSKAVSVPQDFDTWNNSSHGKSAVNSGEFVQSGSPKKSEHNAFDDKEDGGNW